jgi:hypothetical protein
MVETLRAEGEELVVEAEQVEQGGVEIMDGNRVAGDAVTEFIGFTVNGAAFDAAAGEEDRKCLDVVIAAVALGHRGAAEFAAPDDEGVFEHAALLEVGEQGGGALVDEFRGAVAMPFLSPPWWSQPRW